ncbi:MAG: FGGY-family carbohydrate kinase [Actinomycetota bacterium]|nr:FGGY-family carbohydrate kinase [Actinomycetota bacterium]
MLRAVCEGVAYRLCWLLEVAAGAGFSCDPLRAIGGGAKSDVWIQVDADVTPRRVEAVENQQEAGAMGCAMSTAVAVGAFQDFKEIKNAIRVRRFFQPGPGCRAVYDEPYDVFRCLYPRLSGLCGKLNREADNCGKAGSVTDTEPLW